VENRLRNRCAKAAKPLRSGCATAAKPATVVRVI